MYKYVWLCDLALQCIKRAYIDVHYKEDQLNKILEQTEQWSCKCTMYIVHTVQKR